VWQAVTSNNGGGRVFFAETQHFMQQDEASSIWFERGAMTSQKVIAKQTKHEVLF